jgi:cyclopropane-fatty-acyl-phospholipid synthase
MFEHVGVAQYRDYFARIHRLLTPDGIALVHTIGRSAPPAGTNPWVARNIFPGGYVPSMSEATRAIERAGLWMADIECLRLHYALTLQHWRARFEAALPDLPPHLDDRFRRMWRFYLTASEMSFRHGRQAVFQFQLSRRIDAVPITRDYLYPPEGPPLAATAPALAAQ